MIFILGYNIGYETYPEMTRRLCEKDYYMWGMHMGNEIYTKMKKRITSFFWGYGDND